MIASNLWLSPAPLILASTSATRRALVDAAGIPVETEDPAVDERAIEAPLKAAGASPRDVALSLACAKALAVSQRHPGRLVLGGDQTLDCEGTSFSKPGDREAAHRQLMDLAGRTHHLHAAAALARDGEIVFKTVSSAALTMRAMDAAFVSRYLAAAGEAVTRSVGGYQLEGLGVHLFTAITGDHFTILGLPLLSILPALRREAVLA
ncbi:MULTISPECIES: Maf family protein [unclassified Chelatococcus]|uniref:Maf family protein n=1 Tax=unclassified Chelatococcus TaxID=2638111 RepID=UPI001BD08062|nr:MULTISPECIES: Maf family protein [unclassified Chelatococcus]CAH1657179.1 Nucleoside triphosphate pyrophosphatase [Hyphomicrobiales bacterium]MBS7740645.1 Maf family protein [Chelatococcus sp. HY11]MBX3544571.1 Maf family protein [Chelatococcus sp.]MCO5079868.1 Maf family protein [Chelatococcus sp.]CAH1684506.1 Nucleoside triphosphate pyrophosphatase [Hyphomicrobiales bacterium]